MNNIIASLIIAAALMGFAVLKGVAVYSPPDHRQICTDLAKEYQQQPIKDLKEAA